MAHIPFLSHYLERKNIEYQNQLLARQVEEVQNIYLTMRGWRHDYHNHLQSMKAYVEMGQYDKLQEYLGLLENDLDQVNQLCDSGNVNLDAILNSKISLAEKNGIRVDYTKAVSCWQSASSGRPAANSGSRLCAATAETVAMGWNPAFRA